METRELKCDAQFINVAAQGDMHYMADFPYGLALIVAYLREQGFKTLMLQYPTWMKEEYLGTILRASNKTIGTGSESI